MRITMVAEAMAQTANGPAEPAGTGMLFSLLPIILIFIAFYFLLILPQQKRAKQRKSMIEALKKGDKVVTNGGVMGTVTNMTPGTVTLQVADGVRIKFLRSSVEGLKGDEEEK